MHQNAYVRICHEYIYIYICPYPQKIQKNPTSKDPRSRFCRRHQWCQGNRVMTWTWPFGPRNIDNLGPRWYGYCLESKDTCNCITKKGGSTRIFQTNFWFLNPANCDLFGALGQLWIPESLPIPTSNQNLKSKMTPPRLLCQPKVGQLIDLPNGSKWYLLSIRILINLDLKKSTAPWRSHWNGTLSFDGKLSPCSGRRCPKLCTSFQFAFGMPSPPRTSWSSWLGWGNPLLPRLKSRTSN